MFLAAGAGVGGVGFEEDWFSVGELVEPGASDAEQLEKQGEEVCVRARVDLAGRGLCSGQQLAASAKAFR